ncbi:MAG: ParB/RepB/Spo0J family partition protein [Phycisphaerales bacterium]
MVASAKRSGFKDRVQMIPTDRLVPTPDNCRRPITQASVESLSRSIARDGLLQPIVVRRHPEKPGYWEIRAGERRWRAAKLADLKQVPAVVLELDDERALSVTIAENLQRQDLHPLEEAATIQQSFDRGYDVKTVAARLGKSVAYITRRASLSKLSKTWRDAILRPESDTSRLSVAHLELVARLPEETQEHLAENDFRVVFMRGFPSVGDLRRVIDGGLHTLRAMPWELGDDTLDPKAGSCQACPKRSGMHPVLFDAEDAPQNGKVSKTDRCLDPECFGRKQKAFLERREAELRRDHPTLQLVQIGYDGIGPAAREFLSDRVTRVYSPKVVKPSAKSAVPVMQVDGPRAGTLMHLDLGDNATGDGTGRRTARPKDEHGRTKPMPLAERQARLQKRRDAFLVGRVGESLRAFTTDTLATTVGQIQTRKDTAAKGFDPLSLVLAFGTSTRADRDHDDEPWKRYEQLRDRKAGLPVVAALHEVVQVWARRLGGSDTHHVAEQAADARRMCELLGIDAAAIDKEATSAIPTPSSWSGLVDPKATEECPFDANTPTEPAKPTGSTPAPPARPRRARKRGRS